MTHLELGMSGPQIKTVHGRILVVDNDIDICSMMETILSDWFHVVSAGSAGGGLIRMESEPPFDAVISELSLSGMNGMEFLRRVGEKDPESMRILMTGGSGDGVDISRAISEGHVSRIVLKPFRVSTLLEELKRDMSGKNDPPALIDPITEVP